MAKLAVLVVHGIGSQKIDYAEDMIAEINDHIRAAGIDPSEVVWKSVFGLTSRNSRNWNISAKLTEKMTWTTKPCGNLSYRPWVMPLPINSPRVVNNQPTN